MPEIKVLFWDIGGVLLSNGWDREQRALLVGQFGLNAADFQERHHLIVPELELGRLSLDGYLDQTIFYAPRDFSREAFAAAMIAQSEVQQDALTFARGLAAAGRHRMFALNNESRELNEARIRRFRLGEVLEAFFSSCYLGLTKPNPAIYRLALDLAHVSPRQAVMIDDRAQNAEAARSVGMHAIRYENVGQLQDELAKLGVRADSTGVQAR